MTQPTDPNAPYLTVPTTQTDLEARREANYGRPTAETDPNVTDAPYAVEDNDTSAYVGVDADKMNYANDTEKPLKGDGIEDEVCKEQMSGYAYGADAQAEGQQTLGSGSSSPVVAVTSSGEAVTHAIVDREALGKKLAQNAEALVAGKPVEPVKSTDEFLTREEGTPVDEAKTASTANPRPAKAPAPKPSDS